MTRQKRPPVQAVVFDLDDTLYPERQYVRSGYRAVAEYLGRITGREEHFDEWLWARFLRGQSQGAFGSLNDHFELHLGGEEIAELVRLYRGHVPSLTPYAGTGELLSLLRARYRLGLLSDGFLPAQRHKMQALRLERFFDAMVFTEDLGREFWKPSGRGFEEIRNRLATADPHCVYVGDNPEKDFLAPNAMGWRTIQWRRVGQVHADKPASTGGGPQAVVTDAQGLIRALS